ncbi:MAG: ATP-binding protein [Gemmatimonadaceae bacterium]|jgi:signal transduction histidine kinase|nr:ATP-binding protein [Gemmatimonadaceae bacterium]
MRVADPAPTSDLPNWARRVRPLIAHILREEDDLLARWRARLIAAFLLACATLGLAPYIALVFLALEAKLWGLLVLDTTILASIYVLLLSRRVTNTARAVALTLSCFSIGTLALVSRGPVSASLGWLFMSVFLASFLLGRRSATVTVAGTLLVLMGVAVGIATHRVSWAFAQPDLLRAWILTILNFAFLIVVFAATNVVIFGLLEREDAARALAESRLAEARRHEALGTLAGGIAHDFNNLLVPVLVNVTTVHDALPAESPSRAALLDAQRSAEQARDLVGRILAFGRGMDTERTAQDLATIADGAVALARYSAPDSVRFQFETVGPAIVRAAAAELHQICQNLISNAVHALPQGGTVRVAVSALDDEGTPWHVLTVTDNGVGIDERTRERLFDPYFSTRPVGSGTGLGLPIVQGVVTSLGGRIDVTSVVGRGSTFAVRLPAQLRAEPSDAPASSGAIANDATSLDGLRVLLVDDDDAVRRATLRLLGVLGCAAEAVASAADALALVRRTPDGWDLLLTDFRMPGQSGLDLIHTLRAEGVTMPVVLASGHLGDVTEHGEPPTATVLLAKPFTREALASALASARASV